MKIEITDLQHARQTLRMLFDSWVTGTDIEGTTPAYRADLVFDRSLLETLLEEKEKQLLEE